MQRYNDNSKAGKGIIWDEHNFICTIQAFFMYSIPVFSFGSGGKTFKSSNLINLKALICVTCVYESFKTALYPSEQKSIKSCRNV